MRGRRDLLMRQLEVRFGALSEETQMRLARLGIDDLDAIGVRLLNAQSVVEALGTTR